MHYVTKVEYIKNHELLINFEDGRSLLVDLLPHLDGEVFEPLKDVEYFKTARLDQDIDTVVWDNGADFSPDFLYEIGVTRRKNMKIPGREGKMKKAIRGVRR
jgi:hypothetical protein